jgi:DNA-binding transcriptional LysR family regulator
VKNIEFLADPTVGDVSVGAKESVSTGLLPAVYSRLRNRHPGIAMKVVQMATIEQHFRALRERNVDLIVGRIPQSTEPDIAVEVLYHDRTVVATGPRSKWARRKKIELAELADEPWTTAAPDTLVGSLVANAFRAAGLAFPPKGVAFGPMNLHAALSARCGFIGTFPASSLRFASTLPPLKVLPVDLRIPPWPIGIMTLKNRMLSPVVKLFIDRTREVVKPLAKSLPQSPDRG